MHVPFDSFTEEKTEKLVKLLVEKRDIVFLCMHSKLRCAHLDTPECQLNVLRLTELQSS